MTQENKDTVGLLQFLKALMLLTLVGGAICLIGFFIYRGVVSGQWTITLTPPSFMDKDIITHGFVVGLMFLGFGIYWIGNIALIRLRGFLLKARVISLHKFDTGDGVVYKPMYEVIESDSNWKSNWLAGKTILSEMGSNPPNHAVGDVVSVLYDLKAKRIISTKDKYSSLITGAVVIGIGVYGILGGFD